MSTIRPEGAMVAVVVGGSVAGVGAAQSLLRQGYPDRIVLVEAETEEPYDRPPLSKTLLAGRLAPDRIRLLRAKDRADPRLEVRIGTHAVAVHAAGHELELAGGERLRYDHLIVATGASARRAPWNPMLPVLRTLADARRLAAQLRLGGHLVVIGAGVIGCEVAGTARELGMEVTVVDPLSAPIARIVGDELGQHVAAVHRRRGVRMRLGVGVLAVGRTQSGYEVELSDGTVIAADSVLVGIGAVPNDGWLAASGLPVADGVLCDMSSRVDGAADVYAAGDVARWLHPRHGTHVRVEHWTNAVEQADHVARCVVQGGDVAGEFAPVEYAWSDQHGHKIQIVGRPDVGRPTVLVDGDDRLVGALYADVADVLVGAVVLDRPRAMLAAKALIGEQGSVGAAYARWTELVPGLRALTRAQSMRMIGPKSVGGLC